MTPHDAGHPRGRVSLVGAGPGDPDLLTVRALRLIESADAILFDALVDPRIVDLAPRKCIRMGVGKRGDRLSVPQERTNALMARLARRGLHVVRLKGGDPSVFGRVREERDYLAARGVAAEIVPGITAASAAAAQFAFPLTHRGVARRVIYLTARTRDGAPDLTAEQGVGNPQATLVFYMASHVADDVQAALLAAGRAGAEPALIVEHAGSDRARARAGTLSTLGRDAAAAGFDGPTLIVVGPVAAMAVLSRSGEAGDSILQAAAG